MHIIHRWKALGAFFVWTEVFPWTTCFSPNPLLYNMTHILYGYHVLPQKYLQANSLKKSAFKCLGCFTGEGLNRNRIPEGHSWQRQTISPFLPQSWTLPLPQSHVSYLLYLKLCWKHPTGNTFCSCTVWDLARTQMDIIPTGRRGQWCHWNSKGAF